MVTAFLGERMQAIETSDPIEAKRARFAQYRGGIVQFSMMGMTLNGIVQSVVEVAPKQWIVKVLTKGRVASAA